MNKSNSMKSAFFYYMLLTVILLNGCNSTDSEEMAEAAYPDMNTFCFYYNWYGNPEFDGEMIHWKHQVLGQSNTEIIPGTNNNIAANFFPEDGTYSSNDPATIRRQMEEMAKARIGVVVVTWWKNSDSGAKSIPILLDEASRVGLKVSFHIEPYPGRTAISVKEDIKSLLNSYGNHSAFYQFKNKPVFFVYDSYLISKEDWAEVLTAKGKNTIRKTESDAIMIGLLVNVNDKETLKDGGFDGFYTYFASVGFTEGSSPSNWESLQDWSSTNDMIFIPCVGPGYIDTRIRPWNAVTTRDRENGAYYERMFKTAIRSRAPFIGITSYNEWHEGSQIEPSIPMTSKDGTFTYLNFLPNEPDFYIEKTAELVGMFVHSRNN